MLSGYASISYAPLGWAYTVATIDSHNGKIGPSANHKNPTLAGPSEGDKMSHFWNITIRILNFCQCGITKLAAEEKEFLSMLNGFPGVHEYHSPFEANGVNAIDSSLSTEP